MNDMEISKDEVIENVRVAVENLLNVLQDNLILKDFRTEVSDLFNVSDFHHLRLTVDLLIANKKVQP